ncbi:hypothetical protein AB0B25_31500 [Nocardia sp. NPDC049190]|uniref:hypothetical protein n=1 Tax=Nocardia sp. NPDC049190 TaxID=3155650 RepID=UPI0033F5DDC0
MPVPRAEADLVFDRLATNRRQRALDLRRGQDVVGGCNQRLHDAGRARGIERRAELFLQTLAMVAESEANLGHLRTREVMAKARAKSRLKGKQPKLLLAARKTIHHRYHNPDDASVTDLAEEYSVGCSTIHRIISGTAPRA